MSAYPVAYNGTGPNGGDSLHEDLNIWYNVWNVQSILQLTDINITVRPAILLGLSCPRPLSCL